MCKSHCRGPHRPRMRSSHSDHGDQGLPVPYAIAEDPSTCDIVKATQYGMLERCKELVEAGYDVRQADKENVTLLHWAAINNRQELVKYCNSKGAIVDQVGGDLNSTPLHWAIRQGHLPVVMLLLKCGADSSLIDGEGFSSIHLAVLFQHMPIVAYLLSKGQNVDTTDFNGQTPLMITAQKAIGRSSEVCVYEQGWLCMAAENDLKISLDSGLLSSSQKKLAHAAGGSRAAGVEPVLKWSMEIFQPASIISIPPPDFTQKSVVQILGLYTASDGTSDPACDLYTETDLSS